MSFDWITESHRVTHSSTYPRYRKALRIPKFHYTVVLLCVNGLTNLQQSQQVGRIAFDTNIEIIPWNYHGMQLYRHRWTQCEHNQDTIRTQAIETHPASPPSVETDFLVLWAMLAWGKPLHRASALAISLNPMWLDVVQIPLGFYACQFQL